MVLVVLLQIGAKDLTVLLPSMSNIVVTHGYFLRHYEEIEYNSISAFKTAILFDWC